MKIGIIERSNWQYSGVMVLSTTDKEKLDKKWAELKNANHGDSCVRCWTDDYGQEYIRIIPNCGGLSAVYGEVIYKKFSNL